MVKIISDSTCDLTPELLHQYDIRIIPLYVRLGEEEYLANDGNLKTRLTLPRMKSVQDVHAGKYRVPALKKLEGATSTTASASGGQDEQPPADVYDDIPFM